VHAPGTLVGDDEEEEERVAVVSLVALRGKINRTNKTGQENRQTSRQIDKTNRQTDRQVDRGVHVPGTLVGEEEEEEERVAVVSPVTFRCKNNRQHSRLGKYTRQTDKRLDRHSNRKAGMQNKLIDRQRSVCTGHASR
jgi:hypothetical protein